MTWVVADILLAGVFIGFAAGASPAPTGGNVATAVVAFLVGILAAIGRVDTVSENNYTPVAQLAFLFLVALIISYIGTNVLRRKGKLASIGFRGPGK